MTAREPLGFTRYALVAAALVLTAIGILFVHSTLADEGESFPGAAAKRQLIKALVALAAFAAVAAFDYRRLDRLAYVVYGLLVAVLVLLLVLKFSSGGVGRWIDFPFFQVQPSELMKLAVILCLARYLRYRSDQRRVAGLVAPYLLTLIPMGLVLLQPDLGTALMLPPTLLAMLFVGGARMRHILLTILVGLVFLPAAYLLGDRLPLLHGYQRERLTAYIKQSDPATRRHEAYQLAQSQIAIGSGGLFGKGLQRGTQNLHRFVPEKHTDFIFSIIGEEWGFAGASSIVVLFLILVVLCLRVALHTREPFGRLVATGVAVGFAVQSLQNIGMTLGLTPITGLPLPFVSFGGSSLVSSYLALALLVSISLHRVRVVASKDLDPMDRPRALAVVDERAGGTLHARWPV
jgi:rod shape determining protein RodA